ncbi:MAG: hypothetical protein V1774_05535, partial [Candidatus Eisenbacteria bacterium]
PILKTTGPADVFADPQNPVAPLARGITAAGAFAQWNTPVGAAWTSRSDRRGLPPVKPEARVLAFGDASMVTNRFLGMGSNRELAVSAVHWLTEQERFLDIARERSRPAELKIGARGLRSLLYLIEFALPIALAVLGILVWVRRRGG